MLAAAGLLRLGLGHRIGERLPGAVMLPAPGQGALAVTARADDRRAIEAARSAVHHRASALVVSAERAFLRRMEGGCQVPVAGLALVCVRLDGAAWWRLPLSGAEVRAFAVDPFEPGVVYCGTLRGNFYGSRDAGATWEPLASGPAFPGFYVTALVADPAVRGRLWAAVAGELQEYGEMAQVGHLLRHAAVTMVGASAISHTLGGAR